MEGHIYNKSIIHRKKEGFARSVSQVQKRVWHTTIGKRDLTEFLWMSGGAVIIGTSIYLLSIVLI